MGRRSLRKLTTAREQDQIEVRRDVAGQVQFSSVTTGNTTGVSGATSNSNATGTFTLGTPATGLATNVTAQVTGAGTDSGTITISRDGSSLTSTTFTGGTSTVSTSNVLFTAPKNPSITVNLAVTAGTHNATVTVSRESRLV